MIIHLMTLVDTDMIEANNFDDFLDIIGEKTQTEGEAKQLAAALRAMKGEGKDGTHDDQDGAQADTRPLPPRGGRGVATAPTGHEDEDEESSLGCDAISFDGGISFKSGLQFGGRTNGDGGDGGGKEATEARTGEGEEPGPHPPPPPQR